MGTTTDIFPDIDATETPFFCDVIAITKKTETNKRKKIVLSEKKRVLIFGLEPQSISIALILKSRNYIVDIISFEKNPSIKIPNEVGHQLIKNVDKYNFDASKVVRHSDVSGDDVRGKGKGKTDPGSAFDWDKFQAALVG